MIIFGAMRKASSLFVDLYRRVYRIDKGAGRSVIPFIETQDKEPRPLWARSRQCRFYELKITSFRQKRLLRVNAIIMY